MTTSKVLFFECNPKRFDCSRCAAGAFKTDQTIKIRFEKAMIWAKYLIFAKNIRFAKHFSGALLNHDDHKAPGKPF